MGCSQSCEKNDQHKNLHDCVKVSFWCKLVLSCDDVFWRSEWFFFKLQTPFYRDFKGPFDWNSNGYLFEQVTKYLDINSFAPKYRIKYLASRDILKIIIYNNLKLIKLGLHQRIRKKKIFDCFFVFLQSIIISERTLKANLHLMGRSKQTSDPLLCEQKELSIVPKSFFFLHCALSNVNVNKYGCRSQ